MQAGGSPYNTIHGLKPEPSPESCTSLVRHNRSSSEGSIAEVARPDHPSLSQHYDPPSARHISSLLTSEMNNQCTEFKRAYCNVLYNWNLLECRTEMQQYCGRPENGAAEPEFVCECGVCEVALRSHYCSICKRPAILCTVCQLPVRGKVLCTVCQLPVRGKVLCTVCQLPVRGKVLCTVCQLPVRGRMVFFIARAKSSITTSGPYQKLRFSDTSTRFGSTEVKTQKGMGQNPSISYSRLMQGTACCVIGADMAAIRPTFSNGSPPAACVLQAVAASVSATSVSSETCGSCDNSMAASVSATSVSSETCGSSDNSMAASVSSTSVSSGTCGSNDTSFGTSRTVLLLTKVLVPQITLVVRLQKVSDLALFIQLYLEGDALSFYMKVSDGDKASADKVKKRLQIAFADDPFIAYDKLFNMKWSGEPVDVFANGLKHVARLPMHGDVGLERVIKLSFIKGFPDHISVDLKRIPNVLKLEISELIAQVRNLTANQRGGVAAVTVGEAMKERQSKAGSSQFRDNAFGVEASHDPKLQRIVVKGGIPVVTKAVVSDRLVDGVDVVLGTDVIDRLGGVTVA
ncbi:hypothetical protein FHG87_020433 [Trinorchestia longiramus]|nr:hypothetical protein FHG87_020433 [Trinorchestia longiramus]